MKTLYKHFFIILTLLLFLPTKSFSQKAKDSLSDKIKTAAREIMTTAANCALITLDDESRSSIRMMDPFLPEDDFTVWLGTNPNSRKVAQIKKNSKVTLYYVEEGNTGYVTIQGNASLVPPEENKGKWKTEWEAFYPNPAKDYLLIKVIPETMEVVSYPHNLLGDPITWEPPTVIFDENKLE